MTETAALSDQWPASLAAILRRHDFMNRAVACLGRPSAATIRHLVRNVSAAVPADPSPPDDARLLTDLLVFGRPCSVEAGTMLLGPSLLESMIANGLLARSNGIVTSDAYMLVPFHGLVFFVSRLRHERTQPHSIAVYIGRDTQELTAAAISNAGRRTLDLGCGGGLVGITLAAERPGTQVVGTDLCEQAVGIAAINARLNDVAYVARAGDLYAPVADEVFELIVADPPAIALPAELASPIYGSGGESGDGLLRRMVCGLDRHLTKSGQFIAITELQSSLAPPRFVAWAQAWSAEHPEFTVELRHVASRRLPPSYHASLGANLMYLPGTSGGDSALSQQRLVAFAKRQCVLFGNWTHVQIARRRESVRFRQIFDYPQAQPIGRPRRAGTVGHVEEQLASHYPGEIDAFGTHLQSFLRLCTGKQTLASIAEQVAYELKDEFGFSPDESLSYLLRLATAMAQISVLDAVAPDAVDATRAAP
ncbi:methyltransferase [Bradyrhizobium sp. SZCCHNS3051]|uniref:methyltransferase n=1 Tax=Bradyrhizobium sp. SZCCHNS3051 TaxID=3057320 RepID=UPI00291696C1|nr:methyltransferase [Bradyrhizobium sp. SZCCHNS3051]